MLILGERKREKLDLHDVIISLKKIETEKQDNEGQSRH